MSKNLFEFENFEVESRKVKFGVKPVMCIDDLSGEEKEEIFGGSMELVFTIEDALELCR